MSLISLKMFLRIIIRAQQYKTRILFELNILYPPTGASLRLNITYIMNAKSMKIMPAIKHGL